MAAAANVDRYELVGELATGGMATVYLGKQRGPFGFTRTVAIKSMHAHIAKDEGFRAMFLDEATLTARIKHPNVVPTLDIVAAEDKVLLVMEYVEGVSLSTLFRRASASGMRISPAIASAIVGDALRGLHAAHQLRGDDDEPLNVVHRDVSPQNIHVGIDGMARVLDFGVAKASSRRYVTVSGEIKGKLAYMSNEQCCGEDVDHRTDVYAAGVVLWEALTGRRLIVASNEGEFIKKVIEAQFDKPSVAVPELADTPLEHVVMRALAAKKEERWPSADAMADALVAAQAPASRNEVAALVRELAREELDARSARLRVVKGPNTESTAIAELLTEHATQTLKPGMTKMAMTAQSGRRTRSALTVAFGALLVLGLVGAAFALGARRRETGPAAPPPPASTPTVAVSVSAPVSVAPTPPPPPAPVPDPAPVVSVKPKPTPFKRPGKPDCRVPYVIDANGDRHYRPECVD